MKRAILSAALAVAFVAGVAAQGKPNFAGTWQQDMSGAPQGAGGRQGGAPTPQNIVIEGNKMTISRTMGQGGEPVEVTYTSKWEGTALVTTIVNPRGTSTEKRWIEADGSMVVETTRTGQDGTPVTAKVVFKKVTT